MRIQTIATKYLTYLRQFYAGRPGLATQPYSEQHAALMADSFGAPETRTVAFEHLGYETDHVFANAEPMQKRWAEEYGTNISEDYRVDYPAVYEYTWKCENNSGQDFELDGILIDTKNDPHAYAENQGQHH